MLFMFGSLCVCVCEWTGEEGGGWRGSRKNAHVCEYLFFPFMQVWGLVSVSPVCVVHASACVCVCVCVPLCASMCMCMSVCERACLFKRGKEREGEFYAVVCVPVVKDTYAIGNLLCTS